MLSSNEVTLQGNNKAFQVLGHILAIPMYIYVFFEKVKKCYCRADSILRLKATLLIIWVCLTKSIVDFASYFFASPSYSVLL